MLVLFALSIAIVSADPSPRPLPKHLERLQGKWVMEQGERNGTKTEFSQENPNLVLEIRGDKWIFTGVQKGTIIAIDSRSLDIKSAEQGRLGQVDEGIYKVAGDTLTVCLYQGKDRKRPTEFTSKDEDTILAVFKRLKP